VYPAHVCQHGGLQLHEALHCTTYDCTLHSGWYHLGELHVCVEYALNRLLQIDQSEGYTWHLNRKCKLFKLLVNMIHFPGIQTILMSSLKIVLQRFIHVSTNEDSVVLPAVLSSCERLTPGRTSLSPNLISTSLLSLSLAAAHQVSGLHGTDVGHPEHYRPLNSHDSIVWHTISDYFSRSHNDSTFSHYNLPMVLTSAVPSLVPRPPPRFWTRLCHGYLGLKVGWN